MAVAAGFGRAVALILALGLVVGLVVGGCSDASQGPEGSEGSAGGGSTVPSGSPGGGSGATREPAGSPSGDTGSPRRHASPDSPGADASAGPRPPAQPADLDVAVAWRAVRHLAGEIGPRQATSASYRRAARWVETRLRDAGYRVTQQELAVPGGISWGVPVPAGRSVNVVATPPGFRPRRPHLVVGAHLDTVPQAPGAVDNASGVGVLLMVATAVAGRRTRLPVRFVAFGAEEPRGPTDDDHHYGSRAHVAALGPAERAALRGMVSLDRVGTGAVVPVCAAGPGVDPLRRSLLGAAARAGVPAVACENRTSDHWSYVRAGLPGVRLGSTPYAEYHSPADLPGVVDQTQLARVARLTLAWLSPR